jgi:S1-C subfamily serine protease
MLNKALFFYGKPPLGSGKVQRVGGSRRRQRLAGAVVALATLVAGPALADYRTGIEALNRGDHAGALAELRPLAEQDDSRAQWALGYIYRLGLGVEKDLQRAEQWRKRAVRGLLGEPAAASTAPARPPGAVQARRAPPSPPRASGSATGILIDGRGHVLTNAHVTAGCKAIQVQAGRTTAPASFAATAPGADLALLRIAGPIAGEPALFRAEPPAVRGEEVTIVGFPLGGAPGQGPRAGTGVVSALSGPRGDARLIRIDATILPGNSGGPVLDAEGRVIGVVAGILLPEDAARAGMPWPPEIGFAVRGELVAEFLQRAGVRYRTAGGTGIGGPAPAQNAGRFTVRIDCRR